MTKIQPIRDPIALFNDLLAKAQSLPREQIPEPTAFALGTAAANGQPSVRMMLLKHVDQDGFVFYTNLESRKAAELSANRLATMNFFWAQMERQIRVEGRVTPVTPEEADEYFTTRPRGSQVGAWASHQSRPMDHDEDLEARVAEFEKQFEGKVVPRPPNWSGFRLDPVTIEFWRGRPSRLHDRELYTREGHGWRVQRLYP